MNETIKIWMPLEDADRVQKIFDRSELPSFTIIKRFELPEIPRCACLEIAADSAMNIWYLAKTVAIEEDFDRRMDKIRDDLHHSISKVTDKIN